jgi:hypothetical protein
MMPRRLSTAALLLLACLPTVVYGFVVPSHIRPITGGAQHRHKSPPPSITRSNVFSLNGDVDPALIVPDATAIMTSTCSILTADETGGALDIVKNIALAIVVIGGVLAGLAYVFATWMIPQAAKQLEAQTKEVDPALWREYEQKLEPGENLSMRPELMQELGNKVRERIIENYEAAVESQAQAKTATSAAAEDVPTVSSSSSSSSTTSDIVDATIISKEESKRD